MSFNQFIGGLNAGQSAKQNRMIAKEQQGLLAQKSGMLQKQSGYLDEAVNAAETKNYGAGSVKAAAGGNAELAAQLQRLDEGQKSEAKEKLQRAGKIAAALSSLPPDQQVIGIKTYGEEFGLKPEDIEQALANPSVALAKFSSEVRDIEKMIEQSIPEVRTEGDQLINIQTGAGGVANTSELMKRDQTYDEIETNRSNVAGEQLAQDKLGATQFANQTDRMNAKTKALESANGPKPELNDVLKIKDKFEKQAATFEEAQRQFLTMEKLAADGTGTSDVALGFAFFKTIDPSSTVREGEFAQAAKSMGVGGRLVAAMEKLDSGAQFTPQLRKDLVKSASRAYNQQRIDIESLAERTASFAERYNIPAGDVSRNPVRENEPSLDLPPPPSGFVIDGQ